jgi:hypothetical protein
MNFNWFVNSRNQKLSCDSNEIPRLDLTVWGNRKIPDQKPEKPTEEIENNPYERWYFSNFNIAFLISEWIKEML